MRKHIMYEEFAFAPFPGDLLAEHRRTRRSRIVFTGIVLFPFVLFFVLSILAWFDWLATEGWDMDPLGWLFFTLSALSFLLWLILRRLIGFRIVRLYQNGLRLTSPRRDLWIPWMEIERLSHEHTMFYVKLIPLRYNILKIVVEGRRFDIESGSGFAFENWPRLFSEIKLRASNAEYREKSDWMAF